jgi:hypothetical protein
MDFTIPEDASPEFKSFIEANAQTVAKMIEGAKSPLVQKRDELINEQRALQKKIEAYGGFDQIDTIYQKTSEAETARKKAEAEAIEKSGDVEKLKAHYAEQLSARDKELSDMRASALNEKVSAKINAAIREAKGVPELLEPHVRSRIQSALVDGQLKITVLNESGGPMLKSDGKEATVKDLISELRTNAIYQRAFEAPAANGTGGKESSGASVANPWNPATKNVTEQMKLYRQDKAAAQRMAAEFNVKLP